MAASSFYNLGMARALGEAAKAGSQHYRKSSLILSLSKDEAGPQNRGRNARPFQPKSRSAGPASNTRSSPTRLIISAVEPGNQGRARV